MDDDRLKRLGWGVAAVVMVGIGIALMRTSPAPEPGVLVPSGGPASQAPPSEKPMFLEGTPQAYLYDYVEADYNGERLEGANWEKFKNEVIWPVEPNWGSAYVIRSYRLQSGPMTGKDATVEVTYDTLGELDTETFVYTPSPSRQTVPYTMVPRQDRWRIGLPMLRPHVGTEATVRYLERMKVNYPQYRTHIDQSIAALKALQKGATP